MLYQLTIVLQKTTDTQSTYQPHIISQKQPILE